MSSTDFKTLWDSLDEDQRESVKLKAQWEHMSLSKVINTYPGIYASDSERVKGIREARLAKELREPIVDARNQDWD